MPSFASLLAITALALPLAAAGTHHSHPRHAAFVERASVRYRALPRSGRRLAKRADAVLKCTSTKTFSLCDGDNCTDMGSVAAGTACIDGAITWDTSAEASSDDSSAASASVEEPVSSSSQAAPVASTSSVVGQDAVEATQKLAQNYAKASSTTTSFAPASTSAAAVQLNAAASSAAPSSASSSAEDDEDEWDCETDEVEAPSSTSWTSQTTPAARSSSTAKSSSSTPAPSAVQLVASAKPVTTTTTTTSAFTTTPAAPASSSAAPAASSSSASSSNGDWITGGKATFFYQMGAYGACGKIHADSDKIVALAIARYGSGSNNAPDCGRQVEIKNDATGATVTATVADACPGCANYNSLDLSVGAFDAIADQAQGVVSISWKFIS
ncbi:hypothetical protein JCM8097_009252 [Rhodosporidiobolus ruineniae]